MSQHMQQTLGTRQQLNKLSAKELQLLGARVSFSGSVSNLGVTIDSQLTMSDHVASLCRSCFFQLRQLRQVRSSLTTETTQTLVHAFISSRLDYCNSLLYGINDGLLKKLRLFRTPQLVSRQRPGSSTTLRQSCANFTGFRFASASSTS